MRLKEVLNERRVGVAFDRPQRILIHISRPTRRASTIRLGTMVVLSLIFGLIAGRLFEGWWILIATLFAVGIIFYFGYTAPAARELYDSWRYPESYDTFDNETIRDRFLTHTSEFTHIKEK